MSEKHDIERHLNTSVKLRMAYLSGIWADASQMQRMEIVKSVIWTAPDMHTTHRLVVGMLTTEKFLETLD